MFLLQLRLNINWRFFKFLFKLELKSFNCSSFVTPHTRDSNNEPSIERKRSKKNRRDGTSRNSVSVPFSRALSCRSYKFLLRSDSGTLVETRSSRTKSGLACNKNGICFRLCNAIRARISSSWRRMSRYIVHYTRYYTCRTSMTLWL